MIRTHILGFPRIGAQRELKFALEKYWRGESAAAQLEATARELRERHWAQQRAAGLDFVSVGDFALYDHMLNHIQLFGCEPARFDFNAADNELSRYFMMARGVAVHEHDGGPCRHQVGHALEMTKWFDTNYHYLVPEFDASTRFNLSARRLLDEIAEAQALGHTVKVALIGPLTFLYLGKEKESNTNFDRLQLLDALLPAYIELLALFAARGVEWAQID